MRGSRWALLALIVAIVGVFTAKELVKQGRRSRAAAPAVTQEAAPPAPGDPSTEAVTQTERATERDASLAAPRQDKPAPDRSNAAAPPRSGAAAESASAARAAPPPDEATHGPLDGSRLDACLKSGRPTVADFGMGWCQPCRMMEPVLQQAASDYRGKANIVFVDLEQYGDLGREYRIAVMPTQVFFNAKGEEVTRHMGYMGSAQIEEQLAALGVKK